MIFPQGEQLSAEVIEVIRSEVSQYVDRVWNRDRDTTTYQQALDMGAEELTDRMLLYMQLDEVVS